MNSKEQIFEELFCYFRTVNYIAGPGIGYRIVKSSKDPYIPPYFPTIPSAYDPDFVSAGAVNFSPDDSGTDDVFKGTSVIMSYGSKDHHI